MPEEFEHLLAWHFDIRKRKTNGFTGADPVTLEDISLYIEKLERIGIEMEPLEEELLGGIDDVYLDVQSNKMSAPTKPAPNTTTRQH